MGKTSMLKRWIVAGLLTGLTFSAFADSKGKAGQPSDPWQGMNRKVFAFNDAMDRWVLKPVAKGYAKIYLFSLQAEAGPSSPRHFQGRGELQPAAWAGAPGR